MLTLNVYAKISLVLINFSVCFNSDSTDLDVYYKQFEDSIANTLTSDDTFDQLFNVGEVNVNKRKADQNFKKSFVNCKLDCTEGGL
jgi:hypothetical protein